MHLNYNALKNENRMPPLDPGIHGPGHSDPRTQWAGRTVRGASAVDPCLDPPKMTLALTKIETNMYCLYYSNES